ncbi:hypothetical protein M3G03_07600 [Aestuariimicrobium sp. p3-SID1156]|uniref:hypothetical protein n=1 Tax=Aestuariimicrobium sp. p3-SID1156 TaxID=2916038 RepID=UPI00223BF8A1|nr:hypothetical protein [Aestuariimicrobium sp. p3-SID1156]MCT1459404.1 hypothetical protein [Aestuariimicrobium sp. p3-SID1156]
MGVLDGALIGGAEGEHAHPFDARVLGVQRDGLDQVNGDHVLAGQLEEPHLQTVVQLLHPWRREGPVAPQTRGGAGAARGLGGRGGGGHQWAFR